jgi:hypothetical protein
MLQPVEARLVRIPRHLLHIQLDELTPSQRSALLPLLADLPAVPDATLSAQLIGPPHATLACLAVLARHVGQGLRDYNLTLAHDAARLKEARRKLVFLSGAELQSVLAAADARPEHEAVVFVHDSTPALRALLEQRHSRGLASFVAAREPLMPWRRVDLPA